MRGLSTSLTAAAMLIGVGLASAASAGVCPTTGLSATVTRIMEAEGPLPVPPDQAQCYAYGSGNIEGANDAIVNGAGDNNSTFFVDSNFPTAPDPLTDVTFLDKVNHPANSGPYFSFTGGDGNTGGTVTILGPVAGYAQLILALKVGSGNANPDWFSWVIPNLAGTYDWSHSVNPRGGGLSHVNLYGQIPLPAAAWLILGALGGLGAVSRRRKAQLA
jgi:hypothetical protein